MDQVPFAVERLILQRDLAQLMRIQIGNEQAARQDGDAHPASQRFDERVVTDGFHCRAQLKVVQCEQAFGDAAGRAVFLPGEEWQILQCGEVGFALFG